MVDIVPKGRPKGFDENVVLDRAMHTFWREGYTGASMSVLLKDMGISRQSLYDTYGDKRALYLKTLDLYINREVGDILNILNGPPPVLPRVHAVIAHFEEMSLTDQPQGCFIANSLVSLKPDDTELSRILNGALDDLHLALTRSIQSAIDLHEIAPRLGASVLARGILSALMGLAATSKAVNPPEVVAAAVAFITDPLTASQLARP